MYNFTGSYYKTKLVHLNRPINDPQSPHFQNFTEYIFHQKMTNGIQRQQRSFVEKQNKNLPQVLPNLSDTVNHYCDIYQYEIGMFEDYSTP